MQIFSKIPSLIYIATTIMQKFVSHDLPLPLIHPDSPLKQIWFFIFFIAMAYTITVMPYVTCFMQEANPTYDLIDEIVLYVFYCDIVICLISAYHDKDGNLVKSRKTIAVTYLKGWFILDFISCFPFEPIMNAFSYTSGSVSFFQLAKIPRLYRIVRINRIFKILKYVQQDDHFLLGSVNINTGVKKLLQIIILALMFLHIFACLWYFIGTFDEDGMLNWIKGTDNENKSQIELYQLSVYYGLTIVTTIGYGNIFALNTYEYMYSTLAFFFGAAFYSIFTGILSSVYNNLYMKENHINQKIAIAEQICQQYNIEQPILKKMNQAINNNYHYNALRLIDETNLYKELPLNLQTDLFFKFNGYIMEKIDFFFQCKDKKFIARIASQLKAYKYKKNEFIWNQDEISYPQLLEKLDLKSDNNANRFSKQQNFAFKKMVPGSYFGESDVIHNRLRYYSALVESKTCLLYFLTQTVRGFIQDYKFIIKMEYPHIVKQLEKVAEKREKNHLQIFRKIYNYMKNRTSSIKNAQKLKSNHEKRLKRQNSEHFTSKQHLPVIKALKRSYSFPLVDKQFIAQLQKQNLTQLNYQNQYLAYQNKTIVNQFASIRNDLKHLVQSKQIKLNMMGIQERLVALSQK